MMPWVSDAEFKRRHAAATSGPLWKEFRQRALAYYKYRCAVCGLDYLRRMVAEWPLLASIVDNAEMSLAKADPLIAGLYLERGGHPDLVYMIREEYRLTRRLVLAITGRERLLGGHAILRLAVDLRNPYVDALSFLQLRFLRELAAADGSRNQCRQLREVAAQAGFLQKSANFVEPDAGFLQKSGIGDALQ